jgi:hypothetical protein
MPGTLGRVREPAEQRRRYADPNAPFDVEPRVRNGGLHPPYVYSICHP